MSFRSSKIVLLYRRYVAIVLFVSRFHKYLNKQKRCPRASHFWQRFVCWFAFLVQCNQKRCYSVSPSFLKVAWITFVEGFFFLVCVCMSMCACGMTVLHCEVTADCRHTSSHELFNWHTKSLLIRSVWIFWSAAGLWWIVLCADVGGWLGGRDRRKETVIFLPHHADRTLCAVWCGNAQGHASGSFFFLFFSCWHTQTHTCWALWSPGQSSW